MRILHVYPELHPRRGGPPVVVASLARAQAELGAAVSILAPRLDSEASRAFLNEHCSDAVRRIDLPATRGVPLPHGLPVLVRAVATSDVVHIHGVWNPAALPVGTAARVWGRPYVVTAHGMLDDWSLSLKARKKRLGLALGVARMLRGAAALHLLNEDEARTLTTRIPLPARRVVVPNGVFPAPFESLPPPGRFRARHPALGDAPFVLFLGRLHHQKGILLLAEAFEAVARARPELHLVIVGPEQGAGPEVRAIIERAGLSERTHLVGPIYGPERFEAFVDAAVYCLPSYQEGFSIAITEALACGLPAVISENAHWPEVGTLGLGAVTALEPAAIAEGLLEVLADPAAARAMGQRARARVLDVYTWPAIAGRFLELYRELGAA